MFAIRVSLCAVVSIGAFILGMFPAKAYAEDASLFAGVWQISCTPDSATRQAGAKEFSDALIFENDEVMAENFAFYGFAPGAVQVPEGEPQNFSANMESGSKGTLALSGTLANGRLSGQIVWTRKDGSVWKFSFTGTKS